MIGKSKSMFKSKICYFSTLLAFFFIWSGALLTHSADLLLLSYHITLLA